MQNPTENRYSTELPFSLGCGMSGQIVGQKRPVGFLCFFLAVLRWDRLEQCSQPWGRDLGLREESFRSPEEWSEIVHFPRKYIEMRVSTLRLEL